MKRVHSGQVFCNYVAVESIDATLGQVRAHGGEVLMPGTEIAPGMGSIATFNDPEGNQMGLYEFADGEGGS